MSEKPIIFSGEMVRAILEGRKTQTRRVIKNPNVYTGIRDCGFCCPYGQVSDRLWVKEAWQLLRLREDSTPFILYKADNDRSISIWKSPLFMPRWASRITLEITKVRVERLEEITEEDAISESFQPTFVFTPFGGCNEVKAKYLFKGYWDSLNAKRGYPFSSNPWVWVISFRRL